MSLWSKFPLSIKHTTMSCPEAVVPPVVISHAKSESISASTVPPV